ncbi:sugar transferase, partial [Candidatus Uhrbacteria bacterium]|nr:sugar transferase [Candidatus Uhrbacteria bacterium]
AYPFQQYLWYLAGAALLTLVFFAFNGLYQLESNRKLFQDIPRMVTSISATMLVIILGLFFQRSIILSRFLVIVAWATAVIAVAGGRILLTLVQRTLFRSGIGLHRIALIGGGPVGERITKDIATGHVVGYRIVELVHHVDVAALPQIATLYQKDAIDELIVTNAELSRETLHSLGDLSDEYHIPLRYAIDVFPNHRTHLNYTTVGSTPLIEVRRTPLEGWGWIIKRTFDIMISAMVLVITSPIMVVAAIAIWIDSGRPIFFSDLANGAPVERLGRGGRPFHYYKFRTMVPDAHTKRYSKELLANNLRSDGPMVKYANDPRITRVGRFLRKFSIDELPELFLVLKGDMSLVGPRPHFPEEVEQFKKHHKHILEITPGMTGLSQVSGRDELTFEEEVRLDRHYIEHWSLLLDLWILLKTPFVVARGTKDV